jgi:murein L,D-transpeptidase YafK
MSEIRLEIHKGERELRVFEDSKLVRTCSVALGFAPHGDKEIEGDGRTPEGRFYVFTKNAKSKFHLSLGISYPLVEDAERGLSNVLISQDEADSIKQAIEEGQMPLQKTKLGGEIYIHGGGTESDWTDGCIALKDNEIEELFDIVPVGTIVEIMP